MKNMKIGDLQIKLVLPALAIYFLLTIGLGSLAGWYAGRSTVESLKSSLVLHVPSASTSTSPQKKTEPQTLSATSSIKLVPLEYTDGSSAPVPTQIMNRQSPVAVLYLRKKVSDPVLHPEDQVARAVAMTADGWFVTVNTALVGARVSEMALWYNGHAYQVQKAVLDKSSQCVFLKTNATGLSVASFAEPMDSGSAVWLETEEADFVPTSLQSLRSNDNPNPGTSDVAEQRMLVGGIISQAMRGAPVWDSNGSLVGLAEGMNTGRIQTIPAQTISSSLQNLVSEGQIKHALLGVNALNVSLVRSFTSEVLPARGVLLQGTKNLLAVIKGSPAEKAGLKVGDVILQVDRDIIDSSSDLGDIIMQYRPGSSVNFRIWRKGQESNLNVTFGTQITSQNLPN